MRALILVLSLAAVSCKEQYVGAVRSAAADDLRCAEDKIAVTPIDDTTHEHLTAKTFYRATGCGASGTYARLRGWNNWDQKPICGPGTLPK